MFTRSVWPAWIESVAGRDFAQDIRFVTVPNIGTLRESQFRRFLDDARRLPSLRRLTLYHADNNYVKWVSECVPQLETLAINPGTIDDRAIRHLKRLRRLKKLRLSGVRVTGVGFESYEPTAGIETLFLDGADVASSGLAYVGRLSNLRELSLRGCHGVTDANLSSLRKLKSLESIDLRGCSVTHECKKHFTYLWNLVELRGLGTSERFAKGEIPGTP